MPIKDTITDQNDLRVTAELKLNKDRLKQETDTHWRAKNGKGSWNWRLKFPFEISGLQLERSQFKLAMWDADVFSANDSIGEVIMSFNTILKKLWLDRLSKGRLILRKDNTKRFWLDFRHPKYDGPQGRVLVSMEFFTEAEADKLKAGLGRSDPNMNPFLPPPEGRLYFTWNPFDIIRQFLGNRLCCKLCAIFLALACAAILIFFGPQLIITFLSNLVIS